jgi:hypothetical protein
MGWSFDNGGSRPRSESEITRDYRAQAVRAEEEKAEQRRLRSAELHSDMNTPEMRIRSWEKLYGLRLPVDANHPVLDVIAVSTHLTLDQVRDEQRARAARKRLDHDSAAASLQASLKV